MSDLADSDERGGVSCDQAKSDLGGRRSSGPPLELPPRLDTPMEAGQIIDEIARLTELLRYQYSGMLHDRGNAAPALWRSVNDLARHHLVVRRVREKAFGEYVFDDAGWDILLDLFACDGRGSTVKSLCATARRPHTSTLRIIDKLVSAGLINKSTDGLDRRQTRITPTDLASASMCFVFENINKS